MEWAADWGSKLVSMPEINCSSNRKRNKEKDDGAERWQNRYSWIKVIGTEPLTQPFHTCITHITRVQWRVYPLPSAYQWDSCNHSESGVCLKESVKHQYDWPFYGSVFAKKKTGNARQICRKVHESKANTSSAQYSGILPIPCAS